MQVWDSNHVLPVASFQLDQRVYCAAMSPLAHAHALIAAGSGDPAVGSVNPLMHILAHRTAPLPRLPLPHRATPQRHAESWPAARIAMHVQVKLCDARSGAFTHNLTGHRQAVWAAAWSPSSQWHLATGGCDGQVPLNIVPASPAELQRL